jgi:hypothetical protein
MLILEVVKQSGCSCISRPPSDCAMNDGTASMLTILPYIDNEQRCKMRMRNTQWGYGTPLIVSQTLHYVRNVRRRRRNQNDASCGCRGECAVSLWAANGSPVGSCLRRIGCGEWLSTIMCCFTAENDSSFTRGAHEVLHLAHVETNRSHDDRKGRPSSLSPVRPRNI